MHASNISELSHCCAILFGKDVSVTNDFLKFLNPDSLKAACRKKTIEARKEKTNGNENSEKPFGFRFTEIFRAYKRLCSVIEAKPTCLLKEAQDQDEADPVKERETCSFLNFYNGEIPKRRLLLCQYLYYSRRISWQDFVEAVYWLRCHHRPIGNIAKESGVLTSLQIQDTLKQKYKNERFGEAALRMGYLSCEDLSSLLEKQSTERKPIGEYFTDKGLFSQPQMEEIVELQLLRNSIF